MMRLCTICRSSAISVFDVWVLWAGGKGGEDGGLRHCGEEQRSRRGHLGLHSRKVESII